MRKLEGKSALVTGAGRGIGRGIARRLAADGAHVVVNYSKSGEQAEDLVRTITAAGGSAFAVQADVSDLAQIDAMFAAVRRRIDGLDILVNNAGRGAVGRGTLERCTPEDFDAIFGVNTRGLFFVTKAAVAMLRDGGRIINISSTTINVRLTSKGVYAASKCAVGGLTRCWSAELAPRAITVNSVVPGVVDTDQVARMTPEKRALAVAEVPLGRMGQPDDIADVVAFLASDDARWISGQEIVASGGV